MKYLTSLSNSFNKIKISKFDPIMVNKILLMFLALASGFSTSSNCVLNATTVLANCGFNFISVCDDAMDFCGRSEQSLSVTVSIHGIWMIGETIIILNQLKHETTILIATATNPSFKPPIHHPSTINAFNGFILALTTYIIFSSAK